MLQTIETKNISELWYIFEETCKTCMSPTRLLLNKHEQ